MEPHKFENHFKEKLEKRSIQPSENAWSQLENRLNASAKQRKNKQFIWFGVAASIAGILLVASQFLNTNQIEKTAPAIVVTPEVVEQDAPLQVAVEKEHDDIDVDIAEELDSKGKATPIVKKPIASVIETTSKNDVDPEIQKTNPVELKHQTLSYEDQKIKDVITQVQTLKDQNITVTNEEIESLLQQAQKDIRKQKMYDKNTGVVDARLLLEDVESDLEQSFREKAFEALKANFNFIKTAVAKRND